jgi:hypothetical protein
MALFNRVNKAAISPAPPAPKVKAAAAGGYYAQNQGVNMIGQYWSYQEGEARNRAVQVAPISRARDLHASVVSAMPLMMYKEVWNEAEGEMEEVPLAPRSWLRRPDPAIPYETLMSWTLDDLFFFGRAFWYITSRTQDGYPASFTRLPAASVTTRDQQPPVWFAPSKEVYFMGGELDPENLVQFIGSSQGIIYQGEQTIETALQIEASRLRNSQSAIPSGILKQTGGEPLSAQELADLAAAFNAARATNQTAALNEFLSYEPTSATPDKMLLIESANYSALDLSRLCNIPPYLLGISTGSYAYTNSRESRIDLWTFGTKAYAEVIAATLSADTILPRGTMVCFDTEEYIGEVEEMTNMPSQQEPAENTQESLA